MGNTAGKSSVAPISTDRSRPTTFSTATTPRTRSTSMAPAPRPSSPSQRQSPGSLYQGRSSLGSLSRTLPSETTSSNPYSTNSSLPNTATRGRPASPSTSTTQTRHSSISALQRTTAPITSTINPLRRETGLIYPLSTGASSTPSSGPRPLSSYGSSSISSRATTALPVIPQPVSPQTTYSRSSLSNYYSSTSSGTGTTPSSFSYTPSSSTTNIRPVSTSGYTPSYNSASALSSSSPSQISPVKPLVSTTPERTSVTPPSPRLTSDGSSRSRSSSLSGVLNPGALSNLSSVMSSTLPSVSSYGALPSRGDYDSASSRYSSSRPSSAGALVSFPATQSTAAGLNNLGNTCFMAAGLQCLMHTPQLAAYFLTKREESIRTPSNLVSAFAALTREMWSSSYSVSPRDMKNALERIAPIFRGWEQHDTHEFIRVIVDGLHVALNSVPKTPYTTLPSNQNARLAAEAAMSSHYVHNKSVITDLFCGQLCSAVRCSSCSHVSYNFDACYDLSVPLPTTSRYADWTLADCLKAFGEEDTLSAGGYLCEKCKTRPTCYRSLRMSRFPQILVIHIKRFSYGMFGSVKLGGKVTFPLENLDVTPLLPQTKELHEDPAPPVYDLFGVAHHSGSAQGGHYTAHCKSPVNNGWYSFNDSRVSMSDASTVAASSASAYVLFYQKRTAGRSHL